MRRYAHIGTGNYHSSNASNYEDLGLFTADDEIAADVADVFNAVTSRTPPLGFRKLLVGPWYLRDGVVREIGRITAAALAGTPARIRIKVNSLVDPEIVDALYDAATAGASVEVVARGICVLKPGRPALGDRITVRSVLGRFLEHSRILWFETDEEVSVWIGSADLMPRNLDHRVEVLVPIEDARMRAEIGRVLDALGADTRFAWTLDRHEKWKRVEPEPGVARISAQEALMQRAVRRAKRAERQSRRGNVCGSEGSIESTASGRTHSFRSSTPSALETASSSGFAHVCSMRRSAAVMSSGRARVTRKMS